MIVNNLSYDIEWKRFKVGASFFVPCLLIEDGKANIRAVTRRLGFRVIIKPVIEEGIKGLRIWRTK
jgi:hypothetical protein